MVNNCPPPPAWGPHECAKPVFGQQEIQALGGAIEQQCRKAEGEPLWGSGRPDRGEETLVAAGVSLPRRGGPVQLFFTVGKQGGPGGIFGGEKAVLVSCMAPSWTGG